MAEVIYLDSMRQGRSVPVMPLMHRQNPDEMIRIAADRSLIDRVREWVECAEAATADEPLMPRDRVTLMRLVATIHPEPRG
jgi:hypothetical protein